MVAIFIHIPKTAGGSIANWLNTNVNTDHIKAIYAGHVTLQEAKLLHGDPDWSFTVLRNSYDRMISFYEWSKNKLFRRMTKLKKKKEKARGNKKLLVETIKETQYWGERFSAHNKGIVYFMDWAKNENYVGMKSQLDFTKDINHILSFENLNEDFAIIQNLLNCHIPLTQHNKKQEYLKSKYMTNNFIENVQKHFSDEIKYFGFLPKP